MDYLKTPNYYSENIEDHPEKEEEQNENQIVTSQETSEVANVDENAVYEQTAAGQFFNEKRGMRKFDQKFNNLRKNCHRKLSYIIYECFSSFLTRGLYIKSITLLLFI